MVSEKSEINLFSWKSVPDYLHLFDFVTQIGRLLVSKLIVLGNMLVIFLFQYFDIFHQNWETSWNIICRQYMLYIFYGQKIHKMNWLKIDEQQATLNQLRLTAHTAYHHLLKKCMLANHNWTLVFRHIINYQMFDTIRVKLTQIINQLIESSFYRINYQ